MRLTIGTRSFDLTTRALVMGTVGRAGSVARTHEEGADIVEVACVEDMTQDGAILCLAPADDAELTSAVAAGAHLIRLGADASTAAYRLCAGAGTAVVVAATAVSAAEAAGVRGDRIVVADGAGRGDRRPVMVDVTGCTCPLAATAVGVVQGARIVRTADARGARRVCDVLAAVWESGS